MNKKNEKEKPRPSQTKCTVETIHIGEKTSKEIIKELLAMRQKGR